MSAQTDELDNIIASLTNVNAVLKAQEAEVPLAPEVPEDENGPEVPAPAEPTPETPDAPAAAEVPEATPIPVTDGSVADNTPSANITVG